MNIIFHLLLEEQDVLIMGAIAKKLGFGDKLPQTEEELRSWLLSGTAPYAGDFGTSADQKKEKHYKKYETGELRADGKPGFPTPSGKLEICSTILEENGFVPYPEYKDVRSIPELAGKEYPFTMTSGARSNNRMGVFGANLDKIAEIEPYPFVDINAGPLALYVFLSASTGRRNWSYAISYPAGISGSGSTAITLKLTKYSVPGRAFRPFTGTVNSFEACGAMSSDTFPLLTVFPLASTL